MKMIRVRGLKVLLACVLMALCLIGCGSRPASESENRKAAGKENQQEEKTAANEAEATADEEEAAADNAEADQPGEKTEDDTDYTEEGIPIYGKGEKEKIKKYLSTFPDEFLSFQKMKKLGITGGMHNRYLYSEKENQYFDKVWYKFLTVTERGEARERDRKLGKGVHDISTRTAVVLLSYSTEGDSIYDYISYIDGKYYVYTDYSRDKFGGGEFFGSYEEVVTYTAPKEAAVEYYLLRDEDVPEEKWEKWLNSDSGYDVKKITQVYAVENPDEVTAIYND